MDSAPKRPWYRLHWLTWVVTGLVISCVMYRQLEERLVVEGGGTGGMYSEWFNLGWPLAYLEMVKTGPMVVTPAGPSANPAWIHYEWFGLQLIVNCVVCALSAGSAAYEVEAWMRSRRRSQFSLRHLLVITVVVATLMAFTRGLEVRYRDLKSLRVMWFLVSWSDVMNPIRWPLLFGLGCTIYLSGWLPFSLIDRVFARQ